MPRDPYAAHEAEEARLSAALYGAGAGGILGYLRQLPPTFDGTPTARLIRRRLTRRITESPWWWEAWERFEERIRPALATAGRRAARTVLGELPRAARRGITTAAAEEIADNFALQFASEIRVRTAAGLDAAVRGFSQDEPIRELTQRLADQLGPTPRQIRRIQRWERRARAADMPPRGIRRGIRRLSRVASEARARAFASHAVVSQVSATREEVLMAAGALVSSGNPLDSRTRDAHAEQTSITRANPTPAGEPWASGAPFSGLPPYEILCRCWVEDASGPPDVTPKALKERQRKTDTRKTERVAQRLEADKRKLQSAWVHGSRNKTSVHMQEAIRRELGLGVKVWNPKKWPIDEKLIERYRPAVRKLYEDTQASLPSGFVRVYRGSRSSRSMLRGVAESWSDNLDSARVFGGRNVITAEIPTRQVFLYRGGPGWRDGRYGNQGEWVLLGRLP